MSSSLGLVMGEFIAYVRACHFGCLRLVSKSVQVLQKWYRSSCGTEAVVVLTLMILKGRALHMRTWQIFREGSPRSSPRALFMNCLGACFWSKAQFWIYLGLKCQKFITTYSFGHVIVISIDVGIRLSRSISTIWSGSLGTSAPWLRWSTTRPAPSACSGRCRPLGHRDGTKSTNYWTILEQIFCCAVFIEDHMPAIYQTCKCVGLHIPATSMIPWPIEFIGLPEPTRRASEGRLKGGRSWLVKVTCWPGPKQGCCWDCSLNYHSRDIQ